MARPDLVRCPRPVPRSRTWYFLAAIAIGCGAQGIAIVADPSHGGGSHDAAAGWLLLIAGAVQLRLVYRLAGSHPPKSLKLGRPFLSRLLWGVVACWIACQLGGRIPSYEKLLALAVCWYSLCLVASVVSIRGGQWQLWAGRLHLRHAEQAAVALACGVLIGEVGLRVFDWAVDRRLAAREVLARIKLAPGSQYRGQTVNRDGYCDEEFDSDRSAGAFRIAVLGDETILSAQRETGWLAAVEERRPDVKIYNFAMPGCHPGVYAHQMRLDVAPQHPQMVLAFISVGREIQVGPPISPLSWQGWIVARQLWRPPLKTSPASQASVDYEGYLRLIGDRLSICRTPLDSLAQRRWKELLGQLDRLAVQCRKKHVSLALVLVPADYQVSPQLCQAAGRRIGCDPSRLDLELPQRRLINFAAQHDAAVIDLLPHFRASTQSPFCRHEQQLSEQGHRIAARVIGDWLEARDTAIIAAGPGNLRR